MRGYDERHWQTLEYARQVRRADFTPAKQSSAAIVIIAHFVCIASALPTDASALESAISALEREVIALDKSSGCWERWVPWFTALVVIGVAAEVIFLVLEHKEKRASWARGIIRPPNKPSAKSLALEIAATVLIAVGVAGELGIGIAIARINGQLRTKSADLRGKSDQLVALLHVEAENAQQAAGDANALAAKLAKEAEDERMARVKLEKRVNWRRLSPTQAKSLCKDLKPQFTDRLNILPLNGIPGDPEPAEFGDELMTALTNCGVLKPTNSRMSLALCPGPGSIGIWLRAGSLDSSEVPRLKRILDKNGLKVGKVDIFPAHSKDKFGIGICLRP